MKVDRAVVDTNVLISAALSSASPPSQLTRHLLAQGRIVFSDETYAELENRLWKPKFDRYLSKDSRTAPLRDLWSVAEWVELTRFPDLTAVRHSRDADDDKFIHTALAADVPLLISGDGDLLSLGQLPGLLILSPAQAWAQLIPSVGR